MTTRQRFVSRTSALLLLAALPAVAFGQGASSSLQSCEQVRAIEADFNAYLDERFKAFSDSMEADPTDLTDETRAAAVLNADEASRFLGRLLDSYDFGPEYGRALTACFLNDTGEAALARSTTSGLQSPVAAALLQRSGFTDLISAAINGQNLVASDKTAVTVNLNALPILKGQNSFPRTAEEYQATSSIRRWGGSFSFGSEIPKSDLTGFSGVPGADELFDAISWDIRFRAFGDRDPRASRYVAEGTRVITRSALYRALSSRIVEFQVNPPKGVNAQAWSAFFSRVSADIASRDAALYTGFREKAQQQLQVTLQFSGQHLTEDTKDNKLTFSIVGDVSLGFADLVLNGSYSWVNNAELPDASTMSSGTMPEFATLKSVELGAGLTGTLLQGVIASFRGVEWSLSAKANLALENIAGLDRQDVWKFQGALSLPISSSFSLPISVTYTNDPNSLLEQKYVQGRLGISYDFGSVAGWLKQGNDN